MATKQVRDMVNSLEGLVILLRKGRGSFSDGGKDAFASALRIIRKEYEKRLDALSADDMPDDLRIAYQNEREWCKRAVGLISQIIHRIYQSFDGEDFAEQFHMPPDLIERGSDD